MLALSFALVCTVPECSMAGISEWPVLPEREFTMPGTLIASFMGRPTCHLDSAFTREYYNVV